MIRLHKLVYSLLIAALLVPAALLSQTAPEIRAADIQHHVKYLASEKLEGRRTGTPGGDGAAAYLENEFKSYGLKPLGDPKSYVQEFEFVSGVKLAEANTFECVVPAGPFSAKIEKDFRPLGFSSSETYSGPVVFVGYAISDTVKNYDEYAGVDVSGKAVILLRNAPPSDSAREFGAYASLRYKVAKAREKGAKAIIVVTGPEDSEKDDLMRLSYDNAMGNAGIPTINITRAVAQKLLTVVGKDLVAIQKSLNGTKVPDSFELTGVNISMSVSLKEIRAKIKNVVGLLEGTDPLLKDQFIVIGGHYDHLGFGGEGSGSLKPETPAIHYGADDNASGTAGVLELAQAFASRKTALKRSILFIAFTGEELGLLGSGYYVNHPLVPLEATVAMLNMDMIGRLNNKTLIVYGIGTSAGFEAMVNKYNNDSTFVLKLVKDGFGPSDQASFYGKKVPVLHFFTDLHSDYHRPTDTYDRLNYDGEENVLRYIESIANEIASTDDRPQYVAVEMPRQPGTGRSARVTMGTIPDFGEQVQGMKISGVREGGPAAKAGMQGGDVIVKFGNMEIKNLYDFTYALGECKPGDEVDVVIKRGAETKTVKVKLERRN